ncbi:MAG TPA: hypothetical protein VFB07_00685 [Vicinamibacterales bacterium]|nr:hypothetical protein [Vicinamibacterales bacterium]
MSVAVVIFSKDRAAQLDLLLRSWSEQVEEWPDFAVSVLFKSTSPDFTRGYDEVKRAFPTVFFQEEDDRRPFKAQVLELIEREERELFHFLADELVFIRPYSTQDEPFQLLRRRNDIAAVALRMSPRINFAQPINLVTPPPPHRHNMWRWQPRPLWVERVARQFGIHSARGDWSLQLNVDGNTFRYRQFVEHFRSLPEIGGLNKLETTFVLHPMRSLPYLVSYPESRLINLALNRVDPHSNYPFAGLSAADFNARYLAGERLSYAPLIGLQHNACHIIVEPVWQAAAGRS